MHRFYRCWDGIHISHRLVELNWILRFLFFHSPNSWFHFFQCQRTSNVLVFHLNQMLEMTSWQWSWLEALLSEMREEEKYPVNKCRKPVYSPWIPIFTSISKFYGRKVKCYLHLFQVVIPWINIALSGFDNTTFHGVFHFCHFCWHQLLALLGSCNLPLEVNVLHGHVLSFCEHLFLLNVSLYQAFGRWVSDGLSDLCKLKNAIGYALLIQSSTIFWIFQT